MITPNWEGFMGDTTLGSQSYADFEALILQAWAETDHHTSEINWRFRLKDARTDKTWTFSTIQALIHHLEEFFHTGTTTVD